MPSFCANGARIEASNLPFEPRSTRLRQAAVQYGCVVFVGGCFGACGRHRPISNYGLAGGDQELSPGEAMNALMRFAIAIVLVFSMGTCTLLAQSLAEVARETRNAPHARAKKVVTNDDIPSVDTMSTASAPAKDSAKATDDKTASKGESKAGPLESRIGDAGEKRRGAREARRRPERQILAAAGKDLASGAGTESVRARVSAKTTRSFS